MLSISTEQFSKFVQWMRMIPAKHFYILFKEHSKGKRYLCNEFAEWICSSGVPGFDSVDL
jgi:hypothetical protein